MRNGLLIDQFQAEFCPPHGPLDSSLVAALVADFAHETSSAAEEELRNTLSQLSDQASVQMDNEHDLKRLDFWTESAEGSVTTWSEISKSMSMRDSSGSVEQPNLHPVHTHLGFLQSAFPDIPLTQLSAFLDSSSRDDCDMEKTIERILTTEYIRDFEERGGRDIAVESDWSIVQRKRAKHRTADKKRLKPKPIPLIDIRQQHQRVNLHPETSTSAKISTMQFDPWAQVSSLCDYLAGICPPRPASFFSSYYHKPEHAGDLAGATRAALRTIASSNPAQIDPTANGAKLISLLDFILSSSEYASISTDIPPRLVEDAELTMQATLGNVEATFDIIKLIGELDGHQDVVSEPKFWNSKPESALVVARSTFKKQASVVSLSNSPAVLARPSVTQSTSGKKSKTKKATTDDWTHIPLRKTPLAKNPHAAYIPVRTIPNSSFKLAVGETGRSRQTIRADALHRRNELLIEAGRAWKRRGANRLGASGQVALFLAERARAVQEVARKEALEMAREMVESNRLKSEKERTVDLHGTTVAEAIDIVNEVLGRVETSQTSPLKIVTGRGTHSIKGESILKPAVRNGLVAKGWWVSTWDAGLIVKGRR